MSLVYEEREQDLFKMKKEYLLAHCVSVDCAMGAGIALEFRKRIPEMPDEMRKLNPEIGNAIPFQTRGGRTVLNLFTKEKYYHKPSYENFTESINAFREFVLKEGITHVAIPKLGSGLDKLDWKRVSTIIQEIFSEDEVFIVVCIKK